MDDIFGKDLQVKALESMYVYDPLNGVGFPLTEDIQCVDLSRLSHEERLIITLNDPDSVAEFFKQSGTPLVDEFSMAFKVFAIVLKKLIEYKPEDQQEMIEIIRINLKDMADNGIPDDN